MLRRWQWLIFFAASILLACTEPLAETIGSANVIYLIPEQENLLEPDVQLDALFDPQRRTENGLDILVTSDWGLADQGITNGDIQALVVHHAAVEQIDVEQLHSHIDNRCLPLMIIVPKADLLDVAELLTRRQPSQDYFHEGQDDTDLLAHWYTKVSNGSSQGVITLKVEGSLDAQALWGELNRKDPENRCNFASNAQDPVVDTTRDAFLAQEGIGQPTKHGSPNTGQAVYFIPRNLENIEDFARPEAFLTEAGQKKWNVEIYLEDDWAEIEYMIETDAVQALILHHAYLDQVDETFVSFEVSRDCLALGVIGAELNGHQFERLPRQYASQFFIYTQNGWSSESLKYEAWSFLHLLDLNISRLNKCR
ncbi:MAG: hypothetical protein AAGD96_08335 [Chloroflexota bacterium]